ncbi:MAG TPA: hypothetical protein PKD54_10605 [Pirellulaceae bacterium]|nr:hypothetical protein [Pirellulaceae bacterium]
MLDSVLEIGPRVTALPIVHGSGDFAWEVRRILSQESFDCLAVPLPPSVQAPVENAILGLPTPSVVLADESWLPGVTDDEEAGEAAQPRASYVPIDPCQGVIAAIRWAIEERLPIRFIDLEVDQYRPISRPLPDPFALKKVPLAQFASAVVPFLRAPADEQWRQRVECMAWQLRELSIDFRRIVFVCSVLDWPWVRRAYFDRNLARPVDAPQPVAEWHQVDPSTLFFLLGELPYTTELYERARRNLGDDSLLAIDGVKRLLIAARSSYLAEYKRRARRITPKLLALMLHYIRNLTLIEGCFTPQLANIVMAAKQVAGDGYAIHVLERAKQYRIGQPPSQPSARMGIDRIGLNDGRVLAAFNRFPCPPIAWSRIELLPRPDQQDRQKWAQSWNPFHQCSWPPEDVLIENFRQSVFDRAREVMGADLAKTEKFTTSIRDGIDIRDTLRHWYDGDIYVKVLPPNRGKLDTCVMLFDSPADPREYPWRATWYAEHKNESTLAFFATDFHQQVVGPGICLATYGGAMFNFPPMVIPDIWTDERLNWASTLEERLLAAACLHSQCRHIALVSSAPPGPAWRQIAKRFQKAWVHLPLGRFSDSTVQQLRMVHVLNGKQVRSYASQFIRRV